MEFTKDEILISANEKIEEFRQKHGLDAFTIHKQSEFMGMLYSVLDRAQATKKSNLAIKKLKQQ